MNILLKAKRHGYAGNTLNTIKWATKTHRQVSRRSVWICSLSSEILSRDIISRWIVRAVDAFDIVKRRPFSSRNKTKRFYYGDSAEKCNQFVCLSSGSRRFHNRRRLLSNQCLEQRTLISVCVCVLFFYSVSLPNRSSAQCVIEHFAVQIVEKSMKWRRTATRNCCMRKTNRNVICAEAIHHWISHWKMIFSLFCICANFICLCGARNA